VTSEAWCFLIDGISYIAVIASLLMMHVHVPAIVRKATSTFHEMKRAGATFRGSCPSAPF